MPNEWVNFLKKYAQENNISYGCAISEAGPAYRKKKEEKNQKKQITIRVKKKDKPSAKQKDAFDFLKNIAYKTKYSKPQTWDELDYQEDKIKYAKINNWKYNLDVSDRQRVIDLFEKHKGIYKNSPIEGGKEAKHIYDNVMSRQYPNDKYTKLLGQKLKLT